MTTVHDDQANEFQEDYDRRIEEARANIAADVRRNVQRAYEADLQKVMTELRSKGTRKFSPSELANMPQVQHIKRRYKRLGLNIT